MNVHEAALKRMDHLINVYDNVVVSFSGGKDSLTCLLLLREAYKRRGMNKKVESVFLDEEFVHPLTEAYVKHLKETCADWLNLQWFVGQFESELITLSGTQTLIQWDVNRPGGKYFRKIPEFAVRDTDPNQVYDIYTGYRPVRKLYPNGSLVCITGVRTEESSARRMIISGNQERGFYCFISNTDEQAIQKAIPIYDWKIRDIFKYLHDQKFLNEIYNHQMWSGARLRVDTPLHGKARHDMVYMKKYHPEFYESLTEMFPHLHTLQIYSREIFNGSDAELWKQEKRTWEGLVEWCRKKFSGDATQEKQALACVKSAYKSRYTPYTNYPPPFHGFPLYYVWKQIKNMNFDKKIMPLYDKQITEKHYEFENMEMPK